MHALVRVQGHTIAIPSEYVMQAVPAPQALAQLPRRAGEIRGVMTIGRRLVPVVGLARWLSPAGSEHDAEAVERAHGLVLLLTNGEACIGLAVEAVIGTQRIRPAQVRRMFHDDNPDELFQSAAVFDHQDVPISILEPARLMALAGVWVADPALDEALAGDEHEASTAAAGASAAHEEKAVAYAAFRVADAHIALPAANVGELLSHPPLRKELIVHDGVLGLCEWRERLVPVVDLTAALHALPDTDRAAWVCIVCEGDLAIGLVVNEVREIAKIAPDAGTPDGAPASERSVVERRLVTGERTLQVIDVARLLARYAETAISAKGARAAQLRHTLDPAAPAYMVFDAGSMLAARIDGVQEVVTLPDELRDRLAAGMPATLQWREQPVPITPIDDGFVALPAQAARQLIVVCQDKRFAALPIAGVRAMVPRGIAHRNRVRLQGRPVEVISIDTEDHRGSYPVVDLCAALRPVA